ncbi:MAG: V-type ATPase subunit [bacterium]|nr:V-type ATPase subunit [bacterium]
MISLAQKAQEGTKWTYLSGRIKALEKELISRNQYQTLILAKDPKELLRFLSDSAYKSAFRQEEDLFDYERILNSQLAAKLTWIRKYSPQPLVADYFKVRGDIQHLKSRIKSYLSKLPQQEAEEPSELELEKEHRDSLCSEQGEIIQEYLEAYRQIIRAWREKKSLQVVDFEADRKMLAIVYKMAEASSNDLIRRYTQAFLELKNLAALWRLKALGAPASLISEVLFIPPQSALTLEVINKLYEAPANIWPAMLSEFGYQDIFLEEDAAAPYRKGAVSASASGLEKRSDDFLMDILRRAKYIPFGIEVAFAYTAAFWIEILNLKIIIIAKLNHLTEDVIRAKVRQGYV